MKYLRLGILGLLFSTFSFGASKEIVELQRDVALLQDKLDALQRDLDYKLGQLQTLVQQTQDNSARLNAQVQDSINNGVGKQLAPVSGLNTKVDTVSDDVRSLKDALNDLGARMERMDAKITDLKNQIQVIQNPPAAPGATPGTGSPGAPGSPNTSGPPPGMSAEKAYTDARRDLQSGNTDLAQQEFQQYLTYFPNTEFAASAQYYLGEIAYNKGDYNGAVQSFDALLERYPQNPRTADAHLEKANALLKLGQRTRAVAEYRLLVDNFPRTDDARKASQALKALGFSGTSTARRRQ